MNKFRVKVNYTRFDFEDSEEALKFAVSAMNHSTDKDVTVEIEIFNEEEENEV